MKSKKISLNISPVEKLAVIDNIIDKIGKSIADGKLKIGDTLPSERELSIMLEVSRTTVRQALKALDVLGVVKIVHGSHSYLTESSWELLVNPIKFMVLMHKIDEFQLLEERKFIESELTRIAVNRISDSDIKKLGNIIKKLKSCIENQDKFINLEMEFHNIIIKASGYILLPAMMLSISNLLRSIRDRKTITKQNLKDCIYYHEKIFKAIKNRNSENACNAMREHIVNVYKHHSAPS